MWGKLATGKSCCTLGCKGNDADYECDKLHYSNLINKTKRFGFNYSSVIPTLPAPEDEADAENKTD
jgi:hypothetical protein